jgi:hypothetical protein
MNETKILSIDDFKKTLWFSFKQKNVVILNNHIPELSNHDKMEIEDIFTKKINNLIGSIIEYANSRNNGGRSSILEAKRELSCLMQLNLTISYGKEHTPILVDNGIVNNDGIQKFIKEAYESERCISYCK